MQEVNDANELQREIEGLDPVKLLKKSRGTQPAKPSCEVKEANKNRRKRKRAARRKSRA